jgi:hypothetical protein
MTAPRFSKWFSKCLAAGVLFAAVTTELRADEYYDMLDTSMYVDNTDHDLQFFSPVDFDFENQPLIRERGFAFTYDKLSWSGTGERIPVGNPDVTYIAQSPYAGGVIPGQPPAPFTIVNGINDTVPYTKFAWGERYELGMFVKEGSWTVGILDGPEYNSSEIYGFGVGSNEFGFGSVHIGFSAPADYFAGFPDWMQNLIPSIGTIIDITSSPSIVRNIDDVNGNGIFDNGDVINFYPVWEQVNVRNVTEVDGIELMRSFNPTNRHLEVKNQNFHWEFGYGVRYLRIRDEFRVDALGGVYGNSNWDTQIDNNIVGPQIKLKLEKQHSRLNLAATGRFTFGYNVGNWDQEVNFGQELIPGSQNSPYYADPTASSHYKRTDEFSPLVELRIDSSYQITSALAARLGFTSTYVNNIYRAANQVHYNLPNMGFRPDSDTQDIFLNGVNFGFDVVY